MKFLIPFLFSLQLLAVDVSRSVTYDSVTKQVAPSNLVFIAPLTATAPTSSNSVVNKTALDAAVSVGGPNKLDTTNGVAVGLTTATVAASSNDVVSLRAAWKLNGDVRYWGAKGDGVTDDTAALTAAHAAVGKCYYPPGYYMVNGTTIPIGDNFGILTDGPGSVVFKRTTTGSAVFTATENRGATNVVVSGARFVGDYWNSGDITRSAIKLATNSTYGAVFKDCVFDGFVAGLRVARGNTNILVEGCTAYACADALVQAYAPVGGRFLNNTVFGSRDGIGDGYRTRVGIWLPDPGDTGGPGWGNLIEGNKVFGTRNEGIICSAAYSIVSHNFATDCTDGANGTYGIIVETTGATGTGLIGYGAGSLVAVFKNEVWNCDGGIRISVDPVNLTESTPQDVVADDNVVKNCGGANTKGVCIGFSGSGTNYWTYRVSASGNWIHSTNATGNADGVYLLNVQQGAVTGNHIFNPKRAGVMVDTQSGGGTNQAAGIAITANDVHDPGAYGIFLFPRSPGAIARIGVNANNIFFSGTQTGNGIVVDNGVTNGAVECSFVANIIHGNASYNGYGLLLNGSNLLASGNVGNAIYGRIIAANGPTTWRSNGSVNDANGRRVFFGVAAPSSTEEQHNAGDICWNTSMSSGGPVGWICITSGTAGSSVGVWADFGIAGTQAALDLKYDKTGGAISGNLTVGGTFGVTGATTLSGNATVGGTLGVTGVLSQAADQYMANDRKIRFYDSGGTLRDALGLDANNFLTLGYASGANRTYIFGGTGGTFIGQSGVVSPIYLVRQGTAASASTAFNSQVLNFEASSYDTSEHRVYAAIRASPSGYAGNLDFMFNVAGTDQLRLSSNGSHLMTGDLAVSASVTAGAGFYGDGFSVTNIDASKIASNTLPAGRLPAFTGDATSSTGSSVLTLATVSANVGTFGSATQVPSVTYNAKGLATAVTAVTITPAVGSITGLGTGVATLLSGASSGTGGPVGTASPTFTGVVTSPTFTSTIATGTAPLTVASTTLVSNLNADRLDGLHKGGIQPASAALTNLNRTIGFTVDGGGSAITTGKTKGYITAPLAGTIRAWSIAVNAGTATVKVWKVATGTAVPTIANVINTSGVSISSGTYIRSTTLTDFTTTTVAANDVFAFDVTAASTASEMTFQLEITQ